MNQELFSPDSWRDINTMDALAGLAFGIVVIDVIRGSWGKRAGTDRQGYR